jgi:hypothetical protein
LLDMGADTEARDKKGLLPMHFAAAHGKLEVVKFLWSKGAEIDAEDPGAFQPLRKAPSHCPVAVRLQQQTSQLHHTLLSAVDPIYHTFALSSPCARLQATVLLPSRFNSKPHSCITLCCQPSIPSRHLSHSLHAGHAFHRLPQGAARRCTLLRWASRRRWWPSCWRRAPGWTPTTAETMRRCTWRRGVPCGSSWWCNSPALALKGWVALWERKPNECWGPAGEAVPHDALPRTGEAHGSQISGLARCWARAPGRSVCGGLESCARPSTGGRAAGRAAWRWCASCSRPAPRRAS